MNNIICALKCYEAMKLMVYSALPEGLLISYTSHHVLVTALDFISYFSFMVVSTFKKSYAIVMASYSTHLCPLVTSPHIPIIEMLH